MAALCGMATLALLVLLVGWPLSEAARASVRAATSAVLALFVVQEGFRILFQAHPLTFLKQHPWEVLLTLLVGLELVFGPQAVAWLGRWLPVVSASTLALLLLAANQLTVVALVALRGLRDFRLLHSRSLSPGMVFVLSFAAVILLGTLLLKTPQATRAGIGWIDAFFLSTSAVCVTGLSPVDISTTLTRHGQGILLGLIQVGGLGVMTLTYFFAHVMAGGMSLRSRIGLQELLSEENLSQIGGTLALIIGFTVLIETVGAVLIYAALQGAGLPGDERFFFSVFHSISAFCNAGFSTLGPGLADPRVAQHQGFLGTIMALIVLGGLGFPVVRQCSSYVSGHLRFRLRLTRRVPARLSANSRIVLLTTAMLLGMGTLLLWLTEFGFGSSPWTVSPGFTALFHAVTARTAGFHITDLSAMAPASVALMILLMFIGGSPSGAAGGIKTSTLAVAVLSLRRILLGRRDLEAFQRRFDPELADRALSIILVAAAFLALVTLGLLVLHPELPPFDLLFEATSALGTVGLTRGITPKLGPEAKVLLAFAMLVGRVGVLAFVASFLPRRIRPAFRYPETTIVLN